MVEREAAALSLQLNRAKSELICEDPGTCLLLVFMWLIWTRERLQLLQVQDALLLLRHSYAIPKILYVLRSSPSYSSPCLEDYDGRLRNVLSEIMNIRLEPGPSWSQASLPVRVGGTLPVRVGGIRIGNAVQLAPSAYLASAAGCAGLVSSIFPPQLRDTLNPWLSHAEAF